MNINFLKRKPAAISAILIVLALLAALFFDKALFFGILLVVILSAITFYILNKFKLATKPVCLIFFIVLFVHSAMAMFVYYTNFQPFGGGDFLLYQDIAEQVAQRIHLGIFYLDGISYLHYYPVLMGAVYALTMPKMIIAQLISAWLVALSVLLAYLIVIEIGGSKKSAFLIGLIINVYPSYFYFGSLMLKDTFVVPLVLSGLLLSIKMFKKFDALNFFGFFIILTSAIHLRFYIGFALMFSFIVCWFLLSNLKIKKRILYGFIFIFILGFSPYFLGYGYYGLTPLKGYLNKRTITTYREVVYAPDSGPASASASGSTSCSEGKAGVGSSVVVKTGFDEGNAKFVKNYFVSFIYAFLGPFPWQLKYKRHLLFLTETIPWYFLLCFIAWGIYKAFKNSGFLKMLDYYKYSFMLLLFSAMALGALSLFINNFGIIVRIRMPAVIALLCLIGLNKNVDNIINKAINFYEKKFAKLFGLPGLQKGV